MPLAGTTAFRIEQFDLHVFDQNFQVLDLMVHDKTNNAAVGK